MPESTSPLDKFRDMAAPPKKVQPDIAYGDDDEGYTHQIIKFMGRLIAATPHTSKLAYHIAHYMEGDFLDLPGLAPVFPPMKAEHKKAQRKAVQEKREAESQVRLANEEIEKLQRILKGIRKRNDGDTTDVEKAIKDNQELVETHQRKIEKYNKGAEYKPSYPLKSLVPDQEGAKAEDWEVLKKWFDKKTKASAKSKEYNIAKNLDILCDHLKFSAAEKDLIMISICTGEEGNFCDIIENMASRKPKNINTILARMLGVTREEVSKMLMPDSPLVEKGLLIPQSIQGMSDQNVGDVLPDVSNNLVQILSEPDMTLDEMLKRLVGEPATTHLEWNKDFAHLGADGDEVIRLFRGIQETGPQKGINLLFYGAPGTGKTEAVKAAAKHAGIELYMVGEKSFTGAEPTRQDRLSAALLAQALLADKPNAAILLDEMDDLFPSAQGRNAHEMEAHHGEDSSSGQTMGDEKGQGGMSKVYANRFLEKNCVPTFWTSNKPEQFDPAFRRRIMFSLKFQIPPAPVRERLWTTVTAKHDFGIAADDLSSLASRFVVPPGLMDNAARHAAISGGGLGTIERNLRAASGLVFKNRSAIDSKEELPNEYDLRLVNAKVEQGDGTLEELADAIKGSGRSDFSMLLYGVAGSGKSMYFRYMAQHLGMDLLVKKSSSLRDKYVGETEKRIAGAFAEAEERGMILVIDEANTFMRNREKLTENWEVASVEEMLVQMESFRHPFLCTTNLYEDIDVAAKRRFLFKIEFDFLTPQQRSIAFSNYFGMDAPAQLAECPPLTPSEFSNVKKKIPFLKGDVTPDRLVNLLVQEARSRNDKKSDYAGDSPRAPGFAPYRSVA